MKKFIILGLIFLLTGCFNTEERDKLNIYTSAYPFEYATRRIYGHNSNVRSIYPDEIMIEEYFLTDKQIEDYGESDLFIFNSLSYEKEYTIPMYLHNNKLKIIDGAKTIVINNKIEEIWLDPTNYLKVIKNIEEGLLEIIKSHYLQTEIQENYASLRLDISNISANLRRISQKTENNTLVFGVNTFNFLTKFGFNVISLDDNDEITDKMIFDVKKMIEDETLKYIYIGHLDKINKVVAEIIKDSDVEIIRLHTLSSISSENRDNNDDYVTIMNQNIEKLEMQLFDWQINNYKLKL